MGCSGRSVSPLAAERSLGPSAPPPTPHLSAVVQNKHLAVLKGGHGAGVHIEVGVCMAEIQQMIKQNSWLECRFGQAAETREPPTADSGVAAAPVACMPKAPIGCRSACQARAASLPILMEVTLWPHAFSSTPMLLAVMPLPSPLTTPPAHGAQCEHVSPAGLSPAAELENNQGASLLPSRT